MTHVAPVNRHRGFSLIEVLLAVFILGIGIISIASLFPAGIAQQQASIDDILGPTVANNAMSVIRSKVSPADFGAREQHTWGLPWEQGTIEGDWGWSRPAFFTSDVRLNVNFRGNNTAVDVPRGSISIFNDPSSPLNSTTDSEIPWNTVRYPSGAPDPPIIIAQGDRYYPMYTPQPDSRRVARDNEVPQFVWDCMFRRFQGRILVAVFVYRVNSGTGGQVTYTASVQRNARNPLEPPVPFRVPLNPSDQDFNRQYTFGDMWSASEGGSGQPLLEGNAGSVVYDSAVAHQSWQEPRQWIIDQNNNIHRVLSATRKNLTDELEVELMRPVSPVPLLWWNSVTQQNESALYAIPNRANGFTDVVTDIWYIPARVEVDLNGYGQIFADVSLTPVFATIEELEVRAKMSQLTGREPRAGRRQPAFTLTELMIAVLVLLAVIIATSKIFSTASKITGIGQATADIMQEAAAIERQLRADIARLDPGAPFMIRNVIVNNDVNGAALLNPYLTPQGRIRCDQLMFFTSGPETAKTYGGGSGGSGKGQASASRVYFGHGFQLPAGRPVEEEGTPGDVWAWDLVMNNPDRFPPWYAGQADLEKVLFKVSASPDNYITTGSDTINATQPPVLQWLLCRQAVLLVDDGGEQSVYQSDEGFGPSGYRSTSTVRDAVIYNGRVDAAASQMNTIQGFVTLAPDLGSNLVLRPWSKDSFRDTNFDGDQRDVLASLLFYPRAERTAPSAHRVDQALTSHVLAAACSSVVIDWTYENGTGNVDVNGDGLINFEGVNFNQAEQRQWFGWWDETLRGVSTFHRWFGLGMYDVNTQTINPDNIERTLFEGQQGVNSPYVDAHVHEYTFGYNKDQPLNPATGLPWDPPTDNTAFSDAMAYTPLPSGIRVTIVLHDSETKLEAGREFQFIIELPR